MRWGNVMLSKRTKRANLSKIYSDCSSSTYLILASKQRNRFAWFTYNGTIYKFGGHPYPFRLFGKYEALT